MGFRALLGFQGSLALNAEPGSLYESVLGPKVRPLTLTLTYQGRPLGYLAFSRIGFKKIISRNIFQRVLRAMIAQPPSKV